MQLKMQPCKLEFEKIKLKIQNAQAKCHCNDPVMPLGYLNSQMHTQTCH